MKLTPKYCVQDWTCLTFKTEADWQRGIAIVESRISGRFVRWIDRMIKYEFAGFACVALNCLLIETLHGFQSGKSTTKTEKVYTTILTKPPFGLSQTLAKAFYDNVRCGIIHDTETRRGWRITMKHQATVIVEDPPGTFMLNRTMLHGAVKGAFDTWTKDLRNPKCDPTLRQNMRKRMDQIVATHYIK